MAIRILSSENIKGQLNVKDTQDTVFDSGLSVTRSLTTQTGYINIVGGAFNFNAPASISTKFRSNGNELIRIESDGDFWLRQVGKKLYFQNSAGSAPYIKNSGEDASTTPYGRNLEFYTDSYKRIEIDYAGTTTFDSGSNNVVAVFKSTDTETQVNFVDSTGFASIRSRNDFRFYVGGSSLIRAMDIADDGNVGIGTVSPDYKLEVQGVISSADAGLQKATFANVGNDLVLTSNADATNVTAKMLFNSSGAGGAGVSTKMIIDGSGNVGIGTVSPQTKLEVNGGLIKIVENSNTAFYGGDYVRVFGTQSYRFRNSAGSAIAQISLTGNSYFNGGNVGIGETSPEDKLHVSGGNVRIYSTNNANHLILKNNATATSGLFEERIKFLGWNNNENASIIAKGNAYFGTPVNILAFSVSSSEKMSINHSGNVLISGNGIQIDRPDVAGGKPYVFWKSGGTTQASIYGASSGAGLRIFLSGGTAAFDNSISFTGIVQQNAQSVVLSNSAYSNAAAVQAYATNTANVYPGYGFHKASSLGAFLYATSRTELRYRGDGGTDKVLLMADSDYEEGNWTPVIAHNDGTGVIPLNVASARYIKVGDLVYVSAYLTAINPNGNAGGNGAYYGIRGFPFQPENYGAWQIVYASSGVTAYGGYSSSASFYFMTNGTNGQRSQIHVNGPGVNAWGSGVTIMMNCVYNING